MAWRTGAKGGHEQALLLLCPAHKFLHVFGGHFLRVDQQHKVGADHLADGGEVFGRVIGEPVVAARGNAELAGFAQHQGVAIGCGAGGFTGRNQATSTGLVVHDDAHVVPALRELLGHQTRHDVWACASGKAHNDSDGACGVIGLGRRCAKASTQCGQAHADDQAATCEGLFHVCLLSGWFVLKINRVNRLQKSASPHGQGGERRCPQTSAR